MPGSKLYDLNRLRKTYPLRRSKPIYAQIDDTLSGSAIIQCDSNTNFPVTYTFTNTYSEPPVCVATVEDLRMNVFLNSVTSEAVTLRISSRIPADQTIKIHLQVYSDQGE